MEKAEIFNLKGRASFDSNLIRIVFLGFYVITQVLGLTLILIVFGILIYQNVYKSLQPNSAQVGEIVASDQNSAAEAQPAGQMTEIISSNNETTENDPVAQTEAPQANPVNSDPSVVIAPTATALPSSINTFEQNICSPIGGVDFYELASIISQPYNVPNVYSDVGHHGVDFGSYNYNGQYLLGNPIQSVFPGKVAGITINRPPIGNAIIIETPYDNIPESLRSVLGINSQQSIYLLYAHMIDAPVLSIGDTVACGDAIGALGKSQTAEAHLHFETRIGLSNQIIPGMAFYSADATQEEMDSYLLWRTSGIFMPFDPMSLFSNIH
jgi:murein DD-endopeptidase MepM/ murein hydrolase activator NlpD